MNQPAPRKLKAAALMKKLMADHFAAVDAASRHPDRKVAWCTSVGPAELLRAFGFEVYFPENHAAMLGATRMATDLIPAANAIGYSPDICSYLTADVGAYLSHTTPLTQAYGIERVPRPDVLVYNTNQCRDVKDWFAFYSREWDVPLLGIETYRGVGEVTDIHVKGVAGQLRALVPDLERVSGRKLDTTKLEEAVALSRRCSDLWKEALETGAHRPSPLTFFDGTIHMGPAVVLRGTHQAVDYYDLLLGELRQRVEEGVAAVGNERFRLYWEGMPIWGKLRDNASVFMALDTCVVASTYCNSWIFRDLDPIQLLFCSRQILGEGLVEFFDHTDPVQLSLFDFIQFVFYVGGEFQIHDVLKILFQQIIDQDPQFGWIELFVFRGHVITLLNGIDDGGIGAGTSDALFFQSPHQRSLGIPTRRLGEVLLR